MSQSLAFTIDGHPVAWQRAGNTADGGRKFTPHKMRAAQNTASKAGIAAMAGRPLLAVPLRVTIEIVYAIPTSWPRDVIDAARAGRVFHTSPPDADNLAKLLSDAFNRILWHDDAQVAELLVRKRYGEGGERSMVWVQTIGDDVPRTPAQRRLLDTAARHPFGAPQPPKRRSKASSLQATTMTAAEYRATSKKGTR